MILIKTQDEIEFIRQASRIVAEVLLETKKIIKTGIATLEIDCFVEELLAKLGARPAFKGYRGYKHATCLSVNYEVVHGIPSARQLKEGDILSLDVGAIVEGYYGDAAVTVGVGAIQPQASKLLKTTEEALYRGIEQAWAGKHLGDISHAIDAHAKSFGFYVVRDLYGHGVGRNLHEDPLIPNFGEAGSGPELCAGMVLAIEPMLNLGSFEIETMPDGWTVVTRDRKWSAHFEHTILVTEKEPEILTCPP